MRSLVLVICFSCIISGTFSQAFETVVAGVIDFLASHPTTANKMNSTEKAGLSVVGNLLKIAGQRRDINVANAGNHQIIIQEATSGKKAEVFLDPDGNAYLKYNHMIYPINQCFVKQAKEEFAPENVVKNEYLPPYDLEKLEATFGFNLPAEYGKKTPSYYSVKDPDGLFLSEIAMKLGVPVNDIWIESHPSGRLSNRKIRDMMDNVIKVREMTTIGYRSTNLYLPSEVPFLFTCRSAKDLENNGFDFDDFQEVKNSFLKDEEILIVSGYQTDKDSCEYLIEVYQGKTGRLLFRRIGEANPPHEIIQEQINAEVLKPGNYLYVCILRRNKEFLATNQERFEIRDEIDQ
ncbi:MAG: hypothetical protein H8E51_08115 [Bacteroidetes bacterium]|nr:hypothetical protein [Bacteroidota bacterium]